MEKSFKFLLKRSSGDELRRFRGVDMTFEAVKSVVQQWWSADLVYQYTDEDADTVTMSTEIEWTECCRQGAGGTIRVTVFRKKGKKGGVALGDTVPAAVCEVTPPVEEVQHPFPHVYQYPPPPQQPYMMAPLPLPPPPPACWFPSFGQPPHLAQSMSPPPVVRQAVPNPSSCVDSWGEDNIWDPAPGLTAPPTSKGTPSIDDYFEDDWEQPTSPAEAPAVFAVPGVEVEDLFNPVDGPADDFKEVLLSVFPNIDPEKIAVLRVACNGDVRKAVESMLIR